MIIKTLKIMLLATLFGVIIGSVVALFSLAFVYGVQSISEFRVTKSYCIFESSSFCFSISPLLFLLVAAFLIIVVKKTLGISRYHGPADVILSAHSPKEELDAKTGLSSIFAAFVSASGGASVGQYGPLVHLGGTVGSLINNFKSGLLTKDTLIGCGVAAAIAAGFNSPIGGIIFAHEAILRHFSFKAIAPIAVSSVVSATVTNYFFPSGILFQNTDSDIALLSAVSLSLILGPFCAIIAVIFMKGLLKTQSNQNKFSSNEITRILIAATFCGLIGGAVPEVLGLGGETITGIINDSYSFYFLFIILFLKLIVTIACLGLGFFGGVFSPALVLGAAIGGIFTLTGNQLGIISLGDSLILAGMAALSASVIGAPIASIVIIFELTHSYDLAFVSIICVAGSCLVSNAIFGHSFFDKQLLNRKFKISSGRTEILLSERNIEDLLNKDDLLKINKKMSKAQVIAQFKRSNFSEAYVLDDNEMLIGKLNINSLLNESEELDIYKPLTIDSHSSVSEAIVKASNFVGESIPIVNGNGLLLGVVTEADLFSEYLRVQEQISNIEKDELDFC
jgi:CIC family chloride channel protein